MRPRKFFLLCSTLSLFFLRTSAQHEYDVWYFGSNAGINFTSGSPVNLLNGTINTTEGSSCVSDSDGNLLFYTDGVSVKNKNHQTMNNGNGLHGGGSSSQSALILKQPGSDSLYYIFTTGEAGNNYGLQYSIVDMSLQSGLGQVILKNQALVPSTTEKLTSVVNANGTDYWVVVHDYNNKDFYSYQFGASGVNATPVISSVGHILTNVIGCMKGSHNGKQIAFGAQYDNFFELFDFDNATGVVSNTKHLICPPTAFGPYGIEFSPNDSLLYGTAYSGPCVILQWDISSNDSATINNSRIALDSSSASNIGTLQLASDGKIYMAKYGSNYLGVVNNPNVYGFGCNYNDNGFNLNPKSSQLGLPNIPPRLIGAETLNPPVASFNLIQNNLCGQTCIDFTDQSANAPTSWQWNFPGGNPSSSSVQNPTNICYSASGNYDATLIVTNAQGSDTLQITNVVLVYSNPTADIFQSNDTLYSSAANSYQWYTNGNLIGGATDNFYVPSLEGSYVVLITDSNGCTATDTIDFVLSPFSNFTVDQFICQKFCVDYFDQSQNNPTAWKWTFEAGSPSTSTQQNPTGICYNTPGAYDVTLVASNAYGSDTLLMNNFMTVFATPPFPTITQNGYVLTSSGASTYQWQLNSIDIPGATDQSYTVLQTGFYTVIITDENGCVSSTTTYILITGIENEISETGFSVYPHPSNGTFTVVLLNGLMVGYATVELVNALGQKLFSWKGNFSLGKKEIQLSDVADGIYFLEIKSDDIFLKQKIIISK